MYQREAMMALLKTGSMLSGYRSSGESLSILGLFDGGDLNERFSSQSNG